MPHLNDIFIHRFLPGTNSSPQTLLLLHGTGGDENDLIGLGHRLSPDAALLSLRGQVLENGMARFFRRLAEGVFDEADLIYRTNLLADFLSAASNEYGFDPSHVVAVGFSNGANIAASLLLLRPRALAAAALFAPMVPLIPDPLPHLPDTPVFIGAGTHDPLIPRQNTEQLAEMLKAAGAQVRLQWHSGGHSLPSDAVSAATQWLQAI